MAARSETLQAKLQAAPEWDLVICDEAHRMAASLFGNEVKYTKRYRLGQLLKNVALVQTNLNPRLEVSTIVLTMYDARTRLADQVAREVREHFGDTVCRSIVPRTVRLSEAPSFGQPVIVCSRGLRPSAKKRRPISVS